MTPTVLPKPMAWLMPLPEARLIVGLGNPGAEYARHRHNVGFMAIDALADRFKKISFSKKFKGLYANVQVKAKDEYNHQTLHLLKPQTYMNLSGESVLAACQFFKLPPSAVTVIHDEIDLPLGSVRVKIGGGDAGHNGLKSVTAVLGSGYYRIRIGIGHPGQRERVAGYVLEPFSKEEEILLNTIIKTALDTALPSNGHLY
ncbi:MAG: aminoacyl-tRNA hydrolase [Holosporales bacterium]